MVQEQAAEHHEKDREEARRRMVEQERQRLLDEHASKLLGYLPKVGLACRTPRVP